MYQPLADLLRPESLDEVFGQEHILGKKCVYIGEETLHKKPNRRKCP